MKHYGESTLPNKISGATDVLDFLVPFSSALITGLDIISDTSNGTGDVLFDILKNGVSVFSNPANRPKILQGQTSVSLSNLTFAATKSDVVKVRAVTVPAGGIGGGLRLIVTLDDQVGSAPNLSWKGLWKTGVNYFQNDIVLFENNAFIGTATSNSVPPSSDLTKWDLFAGRFLTREQAVTDLYQGAYSRDPDAGELTAGVSALTVDPTPFAMHTAMNSLALSIFADSEYTSLATSDAQFVTDLFEGIIGKQPDAESLTYWTGQLATSGGTRTRAGLVSDIVLSIESVNIRLTGIAGSTIPYGEAATISGVQVAGPPPTVDGQVPTFEQSTSFIKWKEGLRLLAPNPAGTYGDATHVAQITVDAYGRVTSVTPVVVTGGGGSSSSYFDIDTRPVTPSALDDEFAAAGLNAKWIPVNAAPSAAFSFNVDTKLPDHLFLRDNNSGIIEGFFQALPAGDFTVYVKAHILNGPNGTFRHWGLMLADGVTYGTGKQTTLTADAGTGKVSIYNYVNHAFSAAQADIFTDTLLWRYTQYLRLTRIAGVYTAWFSTDGYLWHAGTTLTPSGYTPTHIGIYLSAQLRILELAVDYFRLYPSGTALLGGKR